MVTLNSSLIYILDNLPNVIVDNGSTKQEETHIKIAHLLFWVREWDDQMVEGLRKAIDNNYWGEIITSHIKDIFDLK